MKRLLLVLLVLAALGLAIGVTSLNSIVAAAVEDAGTSALGVETAVDDADVGLLSAEAQLAGLTVANPAGFADTPFLTLGNAGFELRASSLFEDVIRIPAIALSGTRLRIEQRGTESNVATILSNLDHGEGGGGKAPAEGGGKRFLIDRITLTDVQVEVAVSLLSEGTEARTATLTIPELVVEDLGTSEDGAPLHEVIGDVVEALLSATLQADGASILDGTLRETIRGGLEDLGQRGREALDDAVEQTEDKLRGVLEGAEQELGEKAGEILKGIGGRRGDG